MSKRVKKKRSRVDLDGRFRIGLSNGDISVELMVTNLSDGEIFELDVILNATEKRMYERLKAHIIERVERSDYVEADWDTRIDPAEL